jgi:hypothetical protein
MPVPKRRREKDIYDLVQRRRKRKREDEEILILH